MSPKPKQIEPVYQWGALHDWLKAEAPEVAAQLAVVVRGWERSGNGVLHCVALQLFDDGLYGDDLKPESIAYLRREVGDIFYVWLSW